mgnify:FL=1
MTETAPDADTAASNGGGTGDPAGSDLDLDTTFHLLQTERRRLALRYLFERERAGDAVVPMGDVADQVAAWEHDTTVERLESAQRQRVYVGLYQTHLPKLDQHDVVDYDQSRGQVELRPRCRMLEPYLDLAPESGGADSRSQTQADGDAPSEHTLSIRAKHLLLTAVGLVPLAVLASQVGPALVVSTVLLAAVLTIAAIVGGEPQRYVPHTAIS